MKIQKRRLGKTGVDVTLLGLGGEGVLRTFGYDNKARALIDRALDLPENQNSSGDSGRTYRVASKKDERI
jgi:hypothetical protein